MKRIEFQCWRLSVPQGVTYVRFTMFHVRGKLAPKFIDPFKITERERRRIEGRISEFLF
jgi:hypothetical protein